MRILVDTNILIHLEDNKIIDQEFSEFYKLAISNQCKIVYHPDAIPEDIKRDKDDTRKEILLSKLRKYEALEQPALPTPEFLKENNSRKPNDICDNQQLYQLYKGYVDYFVTEDKGIHKKANKLGLQNNTLDCLQALKLLTDNYTIVIPSHPILSHHSIRELEAEFKTDFFDGLRQDYGNDIFDEWLKKCVTQNRKCYSL